jgi:hypothetical protein
MTNNGYLIRRAIRDVLVANLAVTAVGAAAAQAADAPALPIPVRSRCPKW